MSRALYKSERYCISPIFRAAVAFPCHRFAVNGRAGKFIGLEKQVVRESGKIKRTTISLTLQLMALIPRVIATSESRVSGLSTPARPLRRR